MDLKAQFIESDRGRCRHYNGTVHETCRAGVNYRTLVGGEDMGWGLRLPCGLSLNKKALVPTPVRCEQFSPRNDEELVAYAEARVKRMEDLGRAHKAARDDATAKGFKKGHAGAGEVPCPICGGALRYSVAAYNGHMWGKCSTAGCASWME